MKKLLHYKKITMITLFLNISNIIPFLYLYIFFNIVISDCCTDITGEIPFPVIEVVGFGEWVSWPTYVRFCESFVIVFLNDTHITCVKVLNYMDGMSLVKIRFTWSYVAYC